jgi:DNA-binding PadR family transcriptional regulator
MALSHAILSVLIHCPSSGYDLAKQFDGSVGFFWAASHQQIYRELTKLEADGLIAAEVIHQATRPDKKCFHVTESGREHLQAWIAEPSDLPAYKDDWLVKLYAGDQVPVGTLTAQLSHYQHLHQERLATYHAIAQQWLTHQQQFDRGDRYRYLTLQCGIQYETQWLNWCEDVLRFLADESI